MTGVKGQSRPNWLLGCRSIKNSQNFPLKIHILSSRFYAFWVKTSSIYGQTSCVARGFHMQSSPCSYTLQMHFLSDKSNCLIWVQTQIGGCLMMSKVQRGGSLMMSQDCVFRDLERSKNPSGHFEENVSFCKDITLTVSLSRWELPFNNLTRRGQ